jgi:2-isopropylmalate synthase
MGWIENDLTRLADYAQAVSRAVGVPIPAGYPVVGRDAFETATGVHAAAVIKALRRDDLWLADRVYSGVPAAWFGRRQAIRVGPMSGKSNVIWWLEQNGYALDEAVIERILAAAKRTPRLLTDEELHALARGVAT